MSALNSVDKRLIALESLLLDSNNRLTQFPPASACATGSAADIFNTVKKEWAEAESSVSSDVEKLLNKLSYRDPVTDKPRYGEQAQARILDFRDRWATLQNEYKALIEKLEFHISQNPTDAPPPAPVVDTRKNRLVADPAPVRSIDRNREFQASATVGGTCEKEDLELLEGKARLVRERKAAQNQDSSVALKDIEGWLNKFVQYLEKVRQYHAKRSLRKDEASSLLQRPIAQLLRATSEVLFTLFFVHESELV